MVTIEILQSCSGVDFSYHLGQRVEVTPERAADLVKHQSAKYPDPVSEAELLRVKTEQEATQTALDQQRQELEEKQAEFARQMEEFAEKQRLFLEAKAATETATASAAGETATETSTGTETATPTTPPATETATAPKGTGKSAATKQP